MKIIILLFLASIVVVTFWLDYKEIENGLRQENYEQLDELKDKINECKSKNMKCTAYEKKKIFLEEKKPFLLTVFFMWIFQTFEMCISVLNYQALFVFIVIIIIIKIKI